MPVVHQLEPTYSDIVCQIKFRLRQMIGNEIEQLRQAIEHMHGGVAKLAETTSVKETFGGDTVWDGIVHVFDVTENPLATRAYAWSSPIEGSTKRRFFAVLHIPPVDSPQKAVRAAIVAEHRR